MRGGRKEPEQRQGRKEHGVGGSKHPVSMERTPFGLGAWRKGRGGPSAASKDVGWAHMVRGLECPGQEGSWREHHHTARDRGVSTLESPSLADLGAGGDGEEKSSAWSCHGPKLHSPEVKDLGFKPDQSVSKPFSPVPSTCHSTVKAQGQAEGRR